MEIRVAFGLQEVSVTINHGAVEEKRSARYSTAYGDKQTMTQSS